MISLRTTQPRTTRRLVTALTATALLASTALASATPAAAADKTPLIVVGTSDVSDSNLMAAVIEPGFEKAYPDFDLQYVPKGTGAAITYAKAGSADALIVHAASVENQFVADGYSTEQYGRAIFWGDYVLVGPKDDPAGVLTGATHDAATAFEKVAAAGAAGKATFVSRSGSPGTTVQEHAIWNLTNTTTLCKVSAANGGGSAPSTTSGDCSATPTYPSWYQSGDRNQGANVINADVCPYDNGGCYTLTDRGTFQYLKSTDKINNTQIVTRNNDASARGGVPLLVNSFHAYGINPDKFPGQSRTIQKQGAIDLLNWITSADGQTAVGNFLADDPDGRPFLPSASPTFDTTAVSSSVPGNTTVTFAGTLQNETPGTPPLAGKTVTITSAVLGAKGSPTPPLTAFASTKTDANGRFSISYKATQNRAFAITTPPSSQIENSDLSPAFGDLLARGTRDLGEVRVVGTINNLAASAATPGYLKVSGNLAPTVRSDIGRVFLYTRTKGSTGAFTYRDAARPKAGATSFSYSYKVPKGAIEYRLYYSDSTNVDTAYTRIYTTTIR